MGKTGRSADVLMLKGDTMSEPMQEIHLAKILLDIPLFEDLDFSQISSLLKVCHHREVQPGEVLCEPRTIDERLLIFLKGKLRLESAEGGKFAEMTPVRVVGEMGVFTGQTRSSRVVAEQPSTVLELDASELQELVEEDPQIGNHMLVNLVKLLYTRMYDTNEELGLMRDRGERLRERLKELAPDDPLLGELFPEGLIDTEE
jgi:CRP-like cAMP-binding protein